MQFKDKDGEIITGFDVCTGVLAAKSYGESSFGPSVTLPCVLVEVLDIYDHVCSYISLKLEL